MTIQICKIRDGRYSVVRWIEGQSTAVGDVFYFTDRGYKFAPRSQTTIVSADELRQIADWMDEQAATDAAAELESA